MCVSSDTIIYIIVIITCTEKNIIVEPLLSEGRYWKEYLHDIEQPCAIHVCTKHNKHLFNNLLSLPLLSKDLT